MINKLKGRLFTESVTCIIQSLPPLVERCVAFYLKMESMSPRYMTLIYLTSVRSDFVILMFLTDRKTDIDRQFKQLTMCSLRC